MSRQWSGGIDLDDIRVTSKRGAIRGLTLAAEQVLTTARRYVPIEEGTLERSGKSSVDEEGLKAAVSFDTPYAVRQHEDMTARHDSGRTAKYLERAMAEEADTVKQIIAQAIRDGLA